MKVPEHITVEFLTDQDRVTKQDAAFYVGYAQPVAVVKDAENCIAVHCVGEMRVDFYADDSGPDGIRILDTDDLERAGITDDEKLAEAEERMRWHNNPWFILDDTNGLIGLDDTYADLDDALADAVRIVIDFPTE